MECPASFKATVFSEKFISKRRDKSVNVRTDVT
jgi:hypothetical protein